MNEVRCPSCGDVTDFDSDNDVIVCDVCGAILNVMIDPDGDGTTYIAEIV